MRLQLEGLEDRCLLSPSVPVAPLNWTAMGPAPISGEGQAFTGRVAALAADPSDPSGNTIYAGAASGGVWKTTDGGSNWTPLTDSQATTNIGH